MPRLTRAARRRLAADLREWRLAIAAAAQAQQDLTAAQQRGDDQAALDALMDAADDAADAVVSAAAKFADR